MRFLAAVFGLAVLLAACSDAASTTESTTAPTPASTTATLTPTTTTTQGPVFTPDQQSTAVVALDKVLAGEELTRDEATFLCVITLMPPGPLGLWGSEVGLDDRWSETEKASQLDLAVTKLAELGLCG